MPCKRPGANGADGDLSAYAGQVRFGSPGKGRWGLR